MRARSVQQVLEVLAAVAGSLTVTPWAALRRPFPVNRADADCRPHGLMAAPRQKDIYATFLMDNA